MCRTCRTSPTFFAGDIHPDAIGNYFITLVQFATIYGIDPDVLPPVLEIHPALAEVPQDISWQAVRITTAGTG